MSNEFEAKPPKLDLMPLSIGLCGPPGGGKTKSALRLARGMQRVRPGPIVVIDSEAKRSVVYHLGAHNPEGFEFLHVNMKPPFEPERFLKAIQAQLPLEPACIIVDSLSDEHEGPGGYLEMHDDDVPKSGGNEWAAWKRPSRSRKKLIAGFQQITVPLIFTFRAREKTKQEGKKIVNIGYQPVAPAEILYALNLCCLLPLGAHGAAVWTSQKGTENFNLKTVDYLMRYLRNGGVLNEDLGEEFARWALGTAAPARAGEKAPRTDEEMVDDYVSAVNRAGKVDGIDDLENGVAALMKLQQSSAAQSLIERLKERDEVVLVERMTTANGKRYAELTAKVESEDEEREDDTPAASDARDDDDDGPDIFAGNMGGDDTDA